MYTHVSFGLVHTEYAAFDYRNFEIRVVTLFSLNKME